MTIFQKAIKWFEKIFQTLFFQIEEYIFPFAVQFLNQAKKLGDSKVVEFAVNFLPDLQKEQFVKIKSAIGTALKVLPNISYLEFENIQNQDDLNAYLTKTFIDIEFKDKAEKSRLLSTIGAIIIQELTEQDINFATAVMQLEYYYKKIYREDKE